MAKTSLSCGLWPVARGLRKVLSSALPMSPAPRIRSTTILSVRRDGKVALGGDGQVTVGETVMKASAQKVRTLANGRLLAGFAGSAADGLTLFQKFEEKIERYPDNLRDRKSTRLNSGHGYISYAVFC